MSDPVRIPSTLPNLRHGNFDPAAEPVAEVADGAEVIIETVSPYSVDVLTSRGVSQSAILEDEITAVREGAREGPRPHVVTGPVAIENAEPGDVLEVAIRDIELRTSYGVNSFDQGSGILLDAFSDLNIQVIRLDRDRQIARLDDGIEVSINPFFGILAVAPPLDNGRVSTTPPSFFGGNLDINALTAGSTIYLPVNTEGGLFFVGDGHAAQGDGEVNSTAIETSLTGTFEFTLHKDIPHLDYPIAETGEGYIVIGMDEDVDAALKHAVERTISLLTRQHNLTPEAAYHLSSVAVDFTISQAVNGTKGVHGIVPKSFFDGDTGIDPAVFGTPGNWQISA
jgi:acetamidase/formamidase